jgi:hypothetical protein
MNRRNTVKALLATTGALVVLPSWAHSWRAIDIVDNKSFLSIEEQSMLRSLTDTILPKGKTIGALDVQVDVFLEKLFRDCYDTDVRDNIKAQFANLESKAQSTHTKPFAQCSHKEREALFLSLNSTIEPEKKFFNLFKAEAIRGFNTSEMVMVNYLGYKVAPAHYFGSVDV